MHRLCIKTVACFLVIVHCNNEFLNVASLYEVVNLFHNCIKRNADEPKTKEDHHEGE